MDMKPFEEQDIIEKCRIRAEIRRQIKTRKSVQEGAPDRIADTLEEAANEIERLRAQVKEMCHEINTEMRENETLRAELKELQIAVRDYITWECGVTK